MQKKQGKLLQGKYSKQNKITHNDTNRVLKNELSDGMLEKHAKIAGIDEKT